MPDIHPDETPEEYKAPAIVRLGSVDELTRGDIDSSVNTTTGFDSDRILKQEIEPLENALVRLRSVQTR